MHALHDTMSKPCNKVAATSCLSRCCGCSVSGLHHQALGLSLQSQAGSPCTCGLQFAGKLVGFQTCFVEAIGHHSSNQPQ